MQFTHFGGAGVPWAYEFTFVDGQVLLQHQLPVDPEAVQAGTAAWAEGMMHYREWVRTTFPESYAHLFLEGLMTARPEMLELNHEMMDEYFAAADS